MLIVVGGLSACRIFHMQISSFNPLAKSHTCLLCLNVPYSTSSTGLLCSFSSFPPPLPTSLHPLTICLLLIKISKIQMAAGWLLSGNLPLIITGGEARCSVGLAETNGKLDFFTELEWGVEIHILTSHQLAVDQNKCFGLVGEGGSKLCVMLCGISICFLQSPPGCLEDQTDLHLPEQPVREGQGGRTGGGRRAKGHRVNLFFWWLPPPPLQRTWIKM